jgi:2-keto-4-pentenoate hydratase/2-oxohepta-3-ene-1,7-dioic acid hydratase in catechol pathway
MTLKPGDLILSGSPPGVGHCMNPPEYIKVKVLINDHFAIIEIYIDFINGIFRKTK